jgi:hypothetical protein
MDPIIEAAPAPDRAPVSEPQVITTVTDGENGDKIVNVEIPVEEPPNPNDPRRLVFGDHLKKMTACYLRFRILLEEIAKTDPEYSPQKNPIADSLGEFIESLDESGQVGSAKDVQASPLTQTVRSIHMALSVVDVLLDKKWSDIYAALDAGADVGRDATHDDVIDRYLRRDVKGMLACLATLEPIVNLEEAVIEEATEKIEAFRSEFEALYDELNALLDSRGAFIPGESVEEQVAALSEESTDVVEESIFSS